MGGAVAAATTARGLGVGGIGGGATGVGRAVAASMTRWGLGVGGGAEGVGGAGVTKVTNGGLGGGGPTTEGGVVAVEAMRCSAGAGLCSGVEAGREAKCPVGIAASTLAIATDCFRGS